MSRIDDSNDAVNCLALARVARDGVRVINCRELRQINLGGRTLGELNECVSVREPGHGSHIAVRNASRRGTERLAELDTIPNGEAAPLNRKHLRSIAAGVDANDAIANLYLEPVLFWISRDDPAYAAGLYGVDAAGAPEPDSIANLHMAYIAFLGIGECPRNTHLDRAGVGCHPSLCYQAGADHLIEFSPLGIRRRHNQAAVGRCGEVGRCRGPVSLSAIGHFEDGAPSVETLGCLRRCAVTRKLHGMLQGTRLVASALQYGTGLQQVSPANLC